MTEMSGTLPILLSIPHGGTVVPEELADRACITARDLFDDGDAFTREIYDVGDSVARVVKTDIARAFVDLNRASDDRPPQNPDGVVKTATCFNRPIYREGHEWSEENIHRLLKRYYWPYHWELQRATQHAELVLALDCHSMAAVAPPVSAEPGTPRPAFCLSNAYGGTASNSVMSRLAFALATAFDLDRDEVRMNDPFKGGHIIRSHGVGRVPWVQVEMNRALYLSDPWFDEEWLRVDPNRLNDLKRRFHEALVQFFYLSEMLTSGQHGVFYADNIRGSSKDRRTDS